MDVTLMGPARPVEILLVEDSPAHARLTREPLDEGKLLNRLSFVPSRASGCRS